MYHMILNVDWIPQTNIDFDVIYKNASNEKPQFWSQTSSSYLNRI